MSSQIVLLPEFPQQSQTLSGALPLAAMPRLLSRLAGAPAGSARYTLRGNRAANGGLFLRLQLAAKALLPCSRCLQPAATRLGGRRNFVVAGSAPCPLGFEEIDAAPFDLPRFIEDELILSLPMNAAHPLPQCPAARFFAAPAPA